jgi:hypothetical protein
MLLRRVLMIVLSLALVGAVSACGNKQDKTLTAETEGPYIDLGDLKYQVEISRQLNPADVEDRAYLKGVTDTLGNDDVWFAVFVRVQNDSDKTQKPATTYAITDTQDNRYDPVAIDLKSNEFGYDPVPIPGKGLLPNADATAAQNSINGQLLLFKIPRESLDNRPLELKIQNPDDPAQVGVVNLDV